MKLPIVLVHGGLYEGMTAKEFWEASGVLGELRGNHLDHLAPDRPAKPSSWDEEANALLTAVTEAGYDNVALVAASNGCSAAVRFALANPDRVERLMLAWPATNGDSVIDEVMKVIITEDADAETAAAILSGETLRGVTDAELGSLDLPVVVYPPLVENQAHQRSTLMSILATVPGSFMAGGGPDPTDADFADSLDGFITMVTEFSRVEHDD